MQESIKVENIPEVDENIDAVQKQSNLSDLVTSDLKASADHVLDIDEETKGN